jgi:hypothetical protein
MFFRWISRQRPSLYPWYVDKSCLGDEMNEPISMKNTWL